MNARRIFGRPWAEIPLPLRAFMLLSLVELPIAAAHALAGDHPGYAPVALFGPVFAALLLRGWRWLWVFAVLGEIGAFVIPPYHYDLRGWSIYTLVLGLVHLSLLLAPSTRRYVWRRRARMVVPSGLNIDTAVAALPDSGRPDGWFLDPSDPNRMRYWHGESGAWIGRAKTPRKIRRDADVGSIEADAPGPARTSGS